MKNKYLNIYMKIGLMIIAVNQLTNHIIKVSDTVSIVAGITGIILIIVGIIYNMNKKCQELS